MGCTVSGPTAVKIQPDNNGNNIIDTKPPLNGRSKKAVTSLSGDVTSRIDARKERHKRTHQKRNKTMSTAEEMSDKVMDERERLSLGTHMTSRTTSRNTSRTPSPVAKKHVHFAEGNIHGDHGKEMPTKSEPESKISIKLENERANPEVQSQIRVISPGFTNDTELVQFAGNQLSNPIVTVSTCSPRDLEQKKFKFDNIPIDVS